LAEKNEREGQGVDLSFNEIREALSLVFGKKEKRARGGGAHERKGRASRSAKKGAKDGHSTRGRGGGK